MQRNTVISGILTAFAVPILGFALWWLVNKAFLAAEMVDRFGEPFQFTEKTRVLLAISTNLLPTHWAKSRRWDSMLRGLGMTTIGMMLAWAVYYGVFAI